MSLWILSPVSLDQGVEIVVTQDMRGLGKKIIYHRNQYGLRALSMRDNAKAENLIRVLCLGASTTEQTTQETKDTWCGILETRLRKHYEGFDVNIQTAAFGFGGAKALDNALWVYENLDIIQPDIIITLLGINDLAWNGGKNYKPRKIDETLSERSFSTLRDQCKQYSQICRRVVLIKRNLAIRAGLETGEVVEWHTANLANLRKKYQALPYVEKLTRNPDPIVEFKEVIHWLASYLEQRGVPVILLGQPVLWKKSYTPDESNALWFSVNTPNGPVRPSGTWLHGEMRRYNLVQKALANGSGAKYVDLDQQIPKNLLHFFDDCHFTDLGSVSAANNILPTLINTVDSLIQKKGIARASTKPACSEC